ncbi:MAG TPA: patatin-like phospholipase family protein [Polyangiaceae bacterium]|nr:patatin-like phospholipase family protein [Polyangiaceae bacterium]
MRAPFHSPPKTGLVLSGGGMRGAYEVGVILGIVDALRPAPGSPPLFRIFSGASVGAINTAFLAANADQPDHGVSRLAEVWKTLKLEDHTRVRPFGLTGLRIPGSKNSHIGNSLLDTRPLEVLVRRSIDWDRLHRAVDSGRVLAVLIAALHVASGRTTMFTEHAPGVSVIPTRDERRATVFERITADHVLASAAIPLLFPTRRIGEHYYCDGGLRFNTPIAPAIRAGADRVVIVTVRHPRSPGDLAAVEAADTGMRRDLSPVFLIGKLLNALLLDPVAYDLQVLDRLNQVMEVLEQTLSPADYDRVQRVWVQHRGMPYRRLRTLVFMPSRDLGELAGEYIRERLKADTLKPLARYLIERAVRGAPESEADWASYLLFDGDFAAEIIAGGYADAIARKDEIQEFFQG